MPAPLEQDNAGEQQSFVACENQALGAFVSSASTIKRQAAPHKVISCQNAGHFMPMPASFY
jgi:hypothetical protein